MTISLTTFSELGLADEAGKIIPFPEKALLALTYCLSQGRKSISRVELSEFLWNGENADALANLRQLLARVRARQEAIGVNLLSSMDGNIVVKFDQLTVDIADFPASQGPDAAATLQRLLDRFSGIFLGGCEISSERAALWLAKERNRHISMLGQLLEQVASRRSANDAILISDGAHRLLEWDPDSEIAIRSLLEAYCLMGRHGAANALFQRYAERLKRELAAEPGPAITGLMRRLYPYLVLEPLSSATQKAGPDEQAQPKREARLTLPRLIIVPPAKLEGETGRIASALVEDVTIGLCRARSVSIVAPHTASKIAANIDELGQAFDDHNISYALETRLRSDGQELLLYGALVDIRRDEHIWAQRFNISTANLARSYRDIISLIVTTTTDQIERSEFGRIVVGRSPTAYQNYLLGRLNLRDIGLPQLRRARKHFKAALGEEPEFANALSGLSRAEHFEWLVTARGDRELLSSSERHAREAIRTDAANASGYHQLGVVKLYNADFDESLAAFVEAERMAPSHADMIADYADTLVHASEPEQALKKIEVAIDVNPLCPDAYWWTAAGANYCLEKFDVALDCVNKMEDKSTTGRLAAACWGMLGDTAQARKLMRKTMQVYPDFTIDRWLSIMPVKENWQKEQYREGLAKAGFK